MRCAAVLPFLTLLLGLGCGIWFGIQACWEDVELSRKLYHDCQTEKGALFSDLHRCRTG